MITPTITNYFSPTSLGTSGGRPPSLSGGTESGFGSLASAASAAGAESGIPKIDPDTGSSRLMGIAGGAAAGSIFGPVGAVVGGIVGSLGLLDSSSSGERMRAKRTATQGSYGAVQGAYNYINTKTEAANTAYDKGMSSGRARLSGQGIGEDSPQWAELQGGLSKTRSDTLAGLDQEMADFRSSGSMEWFEKDYEYLTDVRSFGGQTQTEGRHEKAPSYKIGFDDHGRSNERLFTDAQQGQLRTGSDKGDMKTYAKMISPGVAAYEKGKFGTDAEKAAFSANMDTRIATANTWFDRKAQENAIKDTWRQARADRQNQRGK